jgi:hypothetical protein
MRVQLSCPAKRGRGTARSAVEGASAVPLALLQIILTAVRPLHRPSGGPLPRFAGADKRKRSRDASAPEFLLTTTKEQRGRRSAERRMPSMVRATIGDIAAADIATDARQTERARVPALRRGLATPVATSIGSAPGRVSWDPALHRVSPAFACPSPARSAQTGRCAGPTVSKAARERSANPHAGTASRFAFRHASRTRPSSERDSLPRTRNRDDCQ